MQDLDTEIFYHYTSLDACLSIVRYKAVWATDYRFLNDRGELRDSVEKFTSKCPKEVYAGIQTALLWHTEHYFHCVLSLSKSPKILSQWRAYANDAQGVALGFSKQFLSKAGLQLFSCVYEDQEKYFEMLLQKHESTLVRASEALAELKAINAFWEWVDENREPFDHLVNDLLVIKNPNFAEEQEVRAIQSVDQQEISFRVARGLLVPYVEKPYWNVEHDGNSGSFLALREIWMGPRCDRRNEISLKRFAPFQTSVQHFDCGYV